MKDTVVDEESIVAGTAKTMKIPHERITLLTIGPILYDVEIASNTDAGNRDVSIVAMASQVIICDCLQHNRR